MFRQLQVVFLATDSTNIRSLRTKLSPEMTVRVQKNFLPLVDAVVALHSVCVGEGREGGGSRCPPAISARESEISCNFPKSIFAESSIIAETRIWSPRQVLVINTRISCHGWLSLGVTNRRQEARATAFWKSLGRGRVVVPPHTTHTQTQPLCADLVL